MYNQDIFFVLSVISFFLIALIKGVYWKHAKLLFMGVFAQRYSNQYLREDNVTKKNTSLILSILMVLNFSIFIWQTIFSENTSFSHFFTVIFFTTIYYLTKYVLMVVLGFIFNVSQVMKISIFYSFLFDKILSFILFPLLVLTHFFILKFELEISLFVLCIFILFYMLKCFGIFRSGINSFGFSRVYLFLYICILEIIPLLLVYKRFF